MIEFPSNFFKLFLGLDISERGPDETTICRFRDDLGKLASELLEEVNRQIEKKGFIIKAGTLIDATFQPAATRPPRKTRNQKIQMLHGELREKGRTKRPAMVISFTLEWTRIQG